MDRFECQGCHEIVTAGADVEDHKARHGLIINIGPAVAHRYQVIVQDSGLKPTYQVRYDGADSGDAMAAWTRAILDGVEYVTLEAIRPTGKTWEGS